MSAYTEEEYRNKVKLANSFLGLTDTVLKHGIAKQGLQDAKNKSILVERNKELAEIRRNDLKYTSEFINDEREDNENKIKSLVDDIRGWGINATEWSKLDDNWQTQGGQDAFKALGIEYGENFQARALFGKNATEQLQNTQNLLQLQRKIIDDLEGKKNELTSLQEDWMKVGTGQGMKGWKDLEDIQHYILQHREKFGVPEGKKAEDMNWVDDVNFKARAFMKQKESGKGFWEYPEAKEMSAVGLSTKAESYGIPRADVVEKDTQMNLNTDFNTIKGTIADIKQEHQDKGKVYSEWLDELDLDNFLDLKGSEKLWDKDPMKLKTKVEGKILGMVNKSTKATRIESWFGTNYPEHENIRKIAGLVPATDITGTDIDESLSLLTAQPLNRYKGVDALYERWLGGELEQRNVDPRTGKETMSYVGKTKVGGAPGIGASGLFNQEYAEDKMYHDDYPRDDKFGTTAEDKLLYDLLSMWKKLDDYAPTYVPQSLR